jgi:hypothetical protein
VLVTSVDADVASIVDLPFVPKGELPNVALRALLDE